MSVPVKSVFQFLSSFGYGWSEVHYWLSPSDNPNLAARLANMQGTIGPARALVLGQDCAIVGFRASYVRAGAIASQSASAYIAGAPGFNSASENDSLACVMQDASNTRQKVIHVRGMWRDVIASEAYHPELVPGDNFVFLLNSWKNQLITSGYGWLGKDSLNSASGQATLYATQLDGTILFTVQGSAQLTALIGKTVQVRFSRLNRSTSVLNRTLICTVVDGFHIQTIVPVAAGAFYSKGRFSISVPTFIAYNSLGPVSLGERRMGKPLNRYPGRRAVKPLS